MLLTRTKHTSASPLTVLIIGTSFDFPQGEAASSRVYWYAKGLREAGADVRVVSLVLPSRGRDPGDGIAAGVHDGLAYEYASGTRQRPASFWRRRWLWLRRALRTAAIVHRAAAGSGGHCVVLVYSEVTSWIVGLALLAKLCGARSVVDLCEFPLVWQPRNAQTSIHRMLRVNLMCRLADGVVPISTYLEDYVKRSSKNPPPMLRVPVMIDPAMFDRERGGHSHAQDRRVVLYCGGLSHINEIQRALRVFAEATAGMPNVRLAVVGGGPATLKAKAEDTARSLGLAGRVEFVERLTREDLAAAMVEAEVLVLPRAPGVFSEAGLPNKLGEYLASGRPVVAAANGDIPVYLQDGTDAYLATPGDDAAFAGRLRHALDHREEADLVGARGREVAVGWFDYRLHGARLYEFIVRETLTRRAASTARRQPATREGDH